MSIDKGFFNNAYRQRKTLEPSYILTLVTDDIIAHQVLLNRVPEQVTEDSVKYQIYY